MQSLHINIAHKSLILVGLSGISNQWKSLLVLFDIDCL